MRRFLLPTLSVLILGFTAHAQESKSALTGGPTMSLTGAVYDINGAVIVNDALIVVARGSDGKVYQTGVNYEGIYALRLPLGVYTVEAGAPWFCPQRVEHFRVVDATHGKMSLDFVLEVGATHTPCRFKPLAGSGPPHKAKPKSKTGIK